MAVIGCIVIGCLFWGDLRSKRQLQALLQTRPPRSDQEFYKTFFSGSPYSVELVTKIRSIFKEYIDIDLSQLEPDDDLSKDFRAIWELDSMADVEIIKSLEDAFSLRISDIEASETRTFRDVVALIHRKTEQGAAANP